MAELFVCEALPGFSDDEVEVGEAESQPASDTASSPEAEPESEPEPEADEDAEGEEVDEDAAEEEEAAEAAEAAESEPEPEAEEAAEASEPEAAAESESGEALLEVEAAVEPPLHEVPPVGVIGSDDDNEPASAPEERHRKRKRRRSSKGGRRSTRPRAEGADADEQQEEQSEVCRLEEDGYLAYVVGARRSGGEVQLLLRAGVPTWWQRSEVWQLLADYTMLRFPHSPALRSRHGAKPRRKWPTGDLEIATPVASDPAWPLTLGWLLQTLTSSVRQRETRDSLGDGECPESLRGALDSEAQSNEDEVWVRLTNVADPLLLASHLVVLRAVPAAPVADAQQQAVFATELVCSVPPLERLHGRYALRRGLLLSWRGALAQRVMLRQKGSGLLADAMSCMQISDHSVALLEALADQQTRLRARRGLQPQQVVRWVRLASLWLAPRFACGLLDQRTLPRTETIRLVVRQSGVTHATPTGKFKNLRDLNNQGRRALLQMLQRCDVHALEPRGLVFGSRATPQHVALLATYHDALCVLASPVWTFDPKLPLRLRLHGLDGALLKQPFPGLTLKTQPLPDLRTWLPEELKHTRPVSLADAVAVVRSKLSPLTEVRGTVAHPQLLAAVQLHALRALELSYGVRCEGQTLPLQPVVVDTTQRCDLQLLRLGHEALAPPHAALGELGSSACAALTAASEADAAADLAEGLRVADLVWGGERAHAQALWQELERLADAARERESSAVLVVLGGIECPFHFAAALARLLRLRVAATDDSRCGSHSAAVSAGGWFEGVRVELRSSNPWPQKNLPTLVVNAWQLRPDLLQRLLRERGPLTLCLPAAARPPASLAWRGLTPLLRSLLAAAPPPPAAAAAEAEVEADEEEKVAPLQPQAAELGELFRRPLLARQPASLCEALYSVKVVVDHECSSLLRRLSPGDHVGDLLYVPRVAHAECKSFAVRVVLDPELSADEWRWLRAARLLALDGSLTPLCEQPGVCVVAPAALARALCLPAVSVSEQCAVPIVWPWQPTVARENE